MVPHHRLWRTNLCASRINLPPFSVMITIRSLSASALLVASLLATALPAVAAEQKAARKPDAAKGQALAGVCAGCHGADGQSPVPTQPNLAGMSAQYIAKQLQHFKTGQRDNAIMNGFAANLSTDDMKDLGAHYARNPVAPKHQRRKLAKTAERLYRGGVLRRHSGLCWLPFANGLASQRCIHVSVATCQYTLAQLTAFKRANVAARQKKTRTQLAR